MDLKKLSEDYCDLVNKTVFFIQEYFEGVVPAGHPDEEVYRMTRKVYAEVGTLRREGRIEEAETLLENYLYFARTYLENGNPPETREKNRRLCRNTILNSVQLVANLTVLLAPVLEDPTRQVSDCFHLAPTKEVQTIHSGYELPEFPLFKLTEKV